MASPGSIPICRFAPRQHVHQHPGFPLPRLCDPGPFLRLFARRFGTTAGLFVTTPKLCHPFPVTACATTRLSGHARAVLFHNGTWGDWRETLRRMPRHARPDGLLSDTRVAASLVDLCGMDVLERLPGRWVFFDRDLTELYGDWREWQGMRASNLYFLPLRSDSPSSPTQPLLKLSATETASVNSSAWFPPPPPPATAH